MYYRYEMRENKDKPWEGVFSFLDPSQRRFWGRRLINPIWYEKNPGVNSRCWFTELGYEKHHEVMDEMIEDYLYHHPETELRILKEPNIQNIVMNGKVQCIEKIA